MGILEIAKLCEFNSKAEAQAVFDYTQMLIEIMNCEELSDLDKNDLIEKVKELSADELNHQNVLQEIYVSLTTIQPKID